MGTSKSQPNDWMTKDGTGKSTVFGDERGWVRTQPDGQEVVIHCMTGVNEEGTIPRIDSVQVPAPGEYSVGAGDILVFNVEFSEAVVVSGTPQISFNENGVSANASYSSGTSTSTNLSFEYVVTDPGVVDTLVQSVQLNGGTIESVDGETAILTFTASITGVTVIA